MAWNGSDRWKQWFITFVPSWVYVITGPSSSIMLDFSGPDRVTTLSFGSSTFTPLPCVVLAPTWNGLDMPGRRTYKEMYPQPSSRRPEPVRVCTCHPASLALGKAHIYTIYLLSFSPCLLPKQDLQLVSTCSHCKPLITNIFLTFSVCPSQEDSEAKNAFK